MKRKLVWFIFMSLLCVTACNKDDDFIEEKKQSPWGEESIVLDSYTLQIDRGNHQTQYVKKVTIDVEEYGYLFSQGRRGEKFNFFEGIGLEEEGYLKYEYFEGEVITASPENIYYIWDKQRSLVDSASINLPDALGKFTVNSFEYNKDTDVLTASWEGVEGADYYSLIISRDIGWIFYETERGQELYPRTTVKNYYDYQIKKGKNSLEITLGINAEFCTTYQSDTFYVFLVAINESKGEDLVKLGTCQQIYKGKLDL